MKTISLENLSSATAQEVFTQVATHLLTQLERSSTSPTPYSNCLYRGPRGLKCAAGCLISDQEYTPALENNPWSILISDCFVPGEHGNLIMSLQLVHDAKNVEDWKEVLSNLAKEKGLEMPKTITIHNLSTFTSQEVFSFIAEHLLRQGEQSMDGEVCKYLDNQGRKCAAGCLIPSEDYTPHMETLIWTKLVDKGLVPEDHSELIRSMQSIHDCNLPEHWEKEIESFAIQQKFEMVEI